MEKETDNYTYLNISRLAQESEINTAIFDRINSMCEFDGEGSRAYSDQNIETHKQKIINIIEAFATPESRLAHDRLLLNQEYYGPNYLISQDYWNKRIEQIEQITEIALSKAAIDFMLGSSLITNMVECGSLDNHHANLQRRDLEIINKDKVEQITNYKNQLLKSAHKNRINILKGLGEMSI